MPSQNWPHGAAENRVCFLCLSANESTHKCTIPRRDSPWNIRVLGADKILGGDRSIQLSYGATRVSGVTVLFTVLAAPPGWPILPGHKRPRPNPPLNEPDALLLAGDAHEAWWRWAVSKVRERRCRNSERRSTWVPADTLCHAPLV